MVSLGLLAKNPEAIRFSGGESFFGISLMIVTI